jgi:hypothetical protein
MTAVDGVEVGDGTARRGSTHNLRRERMTCNLAFGWLLGAEALVARTEGVAGSR